MEVVVTYLTRRAKGGVSRKAEEASVEALRFGRSTHAEVYLADPRVRLDHAAIHQRPGGLFIETEGQADIRVNSESVRTRLLQVGDVIAIGPYDITVIRPPDDKDVAVDVELVRPLGDDLARLQARSTTSLVERGLSRRLWSWLGAFVVLLLFLVVPIIGFIGNEELDPSATSGFRHDTSWDSGPISTAHKFISDQCNLCHQEAFVQVEDTACLSCHEKIEHHFDATDPMFVGIAQYGNTAAAACQSCHKEHNGDGPISIETEQFCVDCHVGIEAQAPEAGLLDVRDFELDHPEFRPTVSVNPADGSVARISLETPEKLIERSGLMFPHDVHLKKKGIRSPEGNEVLECATCHVSQSGDVAFKPIEMEANCERCHQLKFEARRPDRVLPHGQVDNAQLLIREFYSDYALRGGFEGGDEDARAIIRRRPGAAPVVPEVAIKMNPKDWADEQARKVADAAFGNTMCGTCHEVSTGAGLGPLNWSVVPAALTERWLPLGRYDHDSHLQLVDCATCHEAEKSAKATDVLLPSIEVCQDCHGGENAANKVPSTCITCHDYHLDGRPPMKLDAELAWTGPGGVMEQPATGAATEGVE